MDKREQEKRFRELCGKAPAWKKEALLLELYARARAEDREFANDFLSGKKGLFDSLWERR